MINDGNDHKVLAMANMSIRDLPEETYLALKELATSRHGKRSSIEAEARQILIDATRSHQGLGSSLAALGRRLGGVDTAVVRDQEPVQPASFE